MCVCVREREALTLKVFFVYVCLVLYVRIKKETYEN